MQINKQLHFVVNTFKQFRKNLLFFILIKIIDFFCNKIDIIHMFVHYTTNILVS